MWPSECLSSLRKRVTSCLWGLPTTHHTAAVLMKELHRQVGELEAQIKAWHSSGALSQRVARISRHWSVCALSGVTGLHEPIKLRGLEALLEGYSGGKCLAL